MLSVMRFRQAIIVLTAVVFATVDLVHKAVVPAELHHSRSPFVALVMGALVAALIVLVPRLPSNAAALGAGVVCGGALGNLVSIFAWSQGVPDPLMIVGDTHALAFNLADVFALVGDALLLSAAVIYGLRLRRREALREPV
jgi:prepilin signal peptidase PulO-like enzyme (type II secretory pathway)